MAAEDEQGYQARMARDLQDIKSMLAKVITYMNDAEAEVPEKMRRFMMYYHDVKDMVDMYHALGTTPPDYVLREIERCDDRYRHLLKDLQTDTGAFEKVRQDMTQRGGNRYDHTRLLSTEPKS